jgi:hypothetical protein
VITGGNQPGYADIKTFLNRYTPGASLSSTSPAVSSAITVTPPSSASASPLSAQSLAAADSSLVTEQPSIENVALSTQPSALPNHSVLNIQNAELAEGAAVAATQLSSARVQTQPWLVDFLGAQADEEDEFIVTLAG